MLSFNLELCGAKVTLFFRPSISPEIPAYEGGDDRLSSEELPFTKCNVFGRFSAVTKSSIGTIVSLWLNSKLYCECVFSSTNSYSHSSVPTIRKGDF